MASRPFHADSQARNYGAIDGDENGISRASFSRLNETVSNSVMSIKQNTQSLRGLEKQIGTNSDSEDIRKRIQNLIKSTMGKVGTAKQQLGELLATARSSGDRMQQLTSNSVQQSLNSATNSFNAAVERARDKMREYPQPPRMSTPASAYQDSGELDIHGDTAQLIRGSATAQSQVTVSSEASYLEERADRMESLEQDIVTLHGIMGEIGNMVVLQGETIDTIEKHTDEATVNVVAANDQLDRAVKLKRCSRKLKFAICCVVTTIVTVILIVVIIVIAVFVPKNNK